jgi:hypothetical protein
MTCSHPPGPHLPARFSHTILIAGFAISTVALAIPARASNKSGPESLADLELRASQASPREQCYLYTEIVNSMTQEAGKEIASGDTEQAAKTLKKVNQYAHLIQTTIARNAKRLKDAEMLMHNTTYRLGEFLHLVSGDDKTTVQDTLKQLDQVNDELLTQVFTH